MKIGIDARVFRFSEYTGIPRYTLEVLKCWVRDYPEHEYYLLSAREICIPAGFGRNVHRIIYQRNRLRREKNVWWTAVDDVARKSWYFTELYGTIKALDLDVFWGCNFVLPLRKVPNVRYYVTVYDLAAFRKEGTAEEKNLRRLSALLPRSVSIADGIFSISDSTAKDIAEQFPGARDKIHTVYSGGFLDDMADLAYDTGQVRRELRIGAPFFLFLGTIEPRKNIPTIIKAFEKYLEKTKTDEYLVLAGGMGWKTESVTDALGASVYRERIICPGFVNEEEKKYLLDHTQAFVFPSLYEGFGIPILEAFAYATPVITSRVSSMPEVGGDAAFYIEDPLDADALAEQMIRVRASTRKEREERSRQMQCQVERFTWKACAERMMQVICGDMY